MNNTNSGTGGTIAGATETKDPFRETIEVAVGPNADGHTQMAIDAHTRAPDPAIVDDPEAPDSRDDRTES